MIFFHLNKKFKDDTTTQWSHMEPLWNVALLHRWVPLLLPDLCQRKETACTSTAAE